MSAVDDLQRTLDDVEALDYYDTCSYERGVLLEDWAVESGFYPTPMPDAPF